MRVIVLGMNGMLGHYVYNYMYDYFEVVGTTRRELDVTTANVKFVSSNIRPGDVVINCIGLITQRTGIKKLDFIIVNSMFPLIVQEACKEKDAKFIHITTDCVFSGKDGLYNEKDPHDAKDLYGLTKSLGEPDDATVIRTSIIGEETRNYLSLLEWVKNNKNKEVNGYTNHYWNGITCLQFAKLCKHIIDTNCFWTGTKHVFSPELLSKYELIKLISEIFKLDVHVKKHKADVFCNRSLTSIRHDIPIKIPSITEQLHELREKQSWFDHI
jgi:dTDP-4-dehydrorhamnose reductase